MIDSNNGEQDLRFADQFNNIAPYYDEVMSVVPYRHWVKYLRKLFKRYEAYPRRILDIATGTGSVATLLAENEATQVVGIDISPQMIEVATAKAKVAGIPADKLKFICQDACQLEFEDEFDAAVCLFDSFNYILSSRDLRKAFQGVCRSLVPAGLFIFDLNSEYALEKNLFTQDNLWDENTEVKHVWSAQYNKATRIATVDMQFYLPNGKGFREVHKERAHRHSEVIHFLEAAGFSVMDTFHEYSLLPAGKKSERIFYIARKK